MAYKDLRDFIADLESKGELKRIKTEVDSVLEITEITDRVSKKFGPALLFENVKGSKMPVAINLFGNYKRMNMSLGVESLDDIGKEIMSFAEFPKPSSGFLDKLKALPKLAEISNFMPKTVKKGPCQEIIKKGDEVNLEELPVLQCWPEDGGKFITLPLVVTVDPETGRKNLGMYRLQVYDKNTTGMHWHAHHDGAENYRKHQKLGKQMPVAVVLGADPATVYSATAPLPKEIGEYLFSGFLRKSPVELVKCITNDLEVPANAEIILEGYVDLEEKRWEGPFGDHTGYYSLADWYPVFHVTCVTHRKDPIYPTTIVGKPPMEDCYLGKATERIFLPLLKLTLPDIVDMDLPLEGVFHNCVIISIKKQYPKHANKIMHAVWGMGQMMFTKMIIIVDEHVDVHNPSEVWWKVFNNIDAKRDLTIVEGPLDALDHASPYPLWGSKLGIDATKKWASEGHTREWPDDILMSPEIKALVDRKWKEYGFKG